MIMFRADGNGEIGSGHIMRCLSIADAGRRYFNQDSLFVLASDDLKETIRKRGHGCSVLDGDYRHMEPELGKLKELIRLHSPSAVFVDSYYVTSRCLGTLKNAVRREGGRLAYMDDVMSFAYPCDALVNYNIYGPDEKGTYEELYKKAGIPAPEMALGASYAPLREEFQNLPVRRTEKKAKNILISTGGADGEHIALNLAEHLAGSREMSGKEGFGDFGFHFIIGAMNRDYEKIEFITKDVENIFLHRNVANMRQLMCEADVAISAAGSTLYELCAAQTPALTYVLADNQMPGAREFERRHILPCVGDVRNMTGGEAAKRLLWGALELAGDYERRKAISVRQRELVDGRGAKRIAEAVLSP